MKLTQALLLNGYSQSKHDYSLFTKKVGDQIVIMLIYVDDLSIIGNDVELICELKQVLHRNFRMKDLRILKVGIILTQRKYAIELISDIGLTGGKVVVTPLEPNLKLASIEYDEINMMKCTIVSTTHQKVTLFDSHKARYNFAVQHLSQFMQRPKKSHYEAACCLICYVKKNPVRGLFFLAKGSLQLVVFYDSDWASCLMS
ncbi:protein detoxification 35 [Gossypium australe]|uniref:Protein detoxification 35 n=1 Tax=Gossypium australe TaxID=47621 RepID=A0A5B6UYF5_9ROSI|nr:protein detoxification 35 [Gossypium australe]